MFKLKEGYLIFFVDVYLAETVYSFGDGLGFTKYLCTYVLAKNSVSAEKMAKEHYEVKGTQVKSVKAKPAIKQDINCYISASRMIGREEAILPALETV